MPPYVHKRFSRLGLYVSEEARKTLPFRQMLATPLTVHYSACLRGPSFAGIHTILLWLTSIPAEDGRVERKVLGFLDYYLLFDFVAFTQLATNKERQLYLLTGIQRAMNRLVGQEEWDITRFEQAYQSCLNTDLPVAIRY